MHEKDEWLVGPEFLRANPESWPANKVLTEAEKEEAEHSESKKEFIGTLHINNPDMWEVPAKIRVQGWERIVETAESVRKYFYRWYRRVKERQGKPITSSEALSESTESAAQRALAAEKFWYRLIQSAYFSSELETLRAGKNLTKSSKFLGLRPHIDSEGLLRAQGRITRAWDDKNAKPRSELDKFKNQPIILDASHYATKLLIGAYHRRYFHANNETIVHEMRQKYHVIGLRTRLRTIARQCIKCRLLRGKPENPPMADLPASRLAMNNRPFTHCGVDYFGPMYIKIGRARHKRWGVLFTCMVTRAVHLELASTTVSQSCFKSRFEGRQRRQIIE